MSAHEGSAAQAQWQQYQAHALTGLASQMGTNYAPPLTITEQIKNRIEALKKALATVEPQRAELAKLERMLAAAEEVTP